ncbi:MAG: tape measure protein [Aeriscardovia sp.]|nr:tape measure protein [Aeriscardovia sp.]
MARGSRIKGITIELDANITPLQKALSNVDKSLKNTQSSLKDVNKLLKLDPSNTELLKQKQELLKQSIDDTKDRLKTLNEAYKQLDGQGTEEAKKQQELLAREISETEQNLKSLKKEYSDFGSVAKQQLTEVGNQMKEVGGKITDTGKDLSMKLTAPIVALGTVGINYNAQMEQYRTMFTTLTGSAEEADRVIQQLQADAQKSPFDSASLIQANQYLISAGVSADEARTMINSLGDAVSATGGGSAELERMAQNLQQIKNVGKASSQDIKQFANAGINIYGLLAESTGKSIEQVKEMDVTYEELTKAFQMASSEGGKYYGAMEAQGQTLNGSLSATKESIQMLLGSIMESAMPVIVQVLQKVQEVINYLMNLDDGTKRIILIVGGLIAVLGPALMIIGTIISTIGTLITWIGALFSPIGLIVGAIAGVIAIGVALYKNWDTIKQKGSELLSNISNTFERIKSAISDKINSAKEAVHNAIERIKSFFKFEWSLPRLKMPHISISGGFSLFPPSVPHFSVDWYAKAMKNGMVLNNPTIFGMMDGKLLGGGESGSETIVGTNSLMNMIAKASKGTTINMTINAQDQNVYQLADVVIDRLTQKMNRERLVYK